MLLTHLVTATSGCTGVGWKMDQELSAMGVTSASGLRSIPLATLTKTFGERTAKYMYLACRGEVGLQALITQCVQSQYGSLRCTADNALEGNAVFYKKISRRTGDVNASSLPGFCMPH